MADDVVQTSAILSCSIFGPVPVGHCAAARCVALSGLLGVHILVPGCKVRAGLNVRVQERGGPQRHRDQVDRRYTANRVRSSSNLHPSFIASTSSGSIPGDGYLCTIYCHLVSGYTHQRRHHHMKPDIDRGLRLTATDIETGSSRFPPLREALQSYHRVEHHGHPASDFD